MAFISVFSLCIFQSNWKFKYTQIFFPPTSSPTQIYQQSMRLVVDLMKIKSTKIFTISRHLMIYPFSTCQLVSYLSFTCVCVYVCTIRCLRAKSDTFSGFIQKFIFEFNSNAPLSMFDFTLCRKDMTVMG